MLQLVKNTKVCKTCGEEKSLEEFRREQRTNGLHYHSECKDCGNGPCKVDKICTKCGEFKKAEEFRRKRDSICGKCATKDRNRLRMEIKLKAIGYLGGICFDCKKDYPSGVYDLHHKDPSQRPITKRNRDGSSGGNFMEKSFKRIG